jgi:hypothetical protein
MSIESKEETHMKEKKRIRISIHPVEDCPGNYLAYFRSEFLDATYTVFFKDTITGALALHSFAEMIRRKYQEKEVDFLLSEQELPFRNEALLDVVTRRPACFFGKLVSAQA